MAAEIWWAEGAHAIAALRIRSDQELVALARLLGFPTGTDRPLTDPLYRVHRSTGTDRSDAFSDDELAPEDWLGNLDVAAPDEPTGPAPGSDGDGSALRPVAIDPVPSTRDGPTLPEPDGAGGHPPLPHDPLLAPNSARSILQFLLSRPVPEGPPDLSNAVESVAHGRPIHQMPSLPQLTLRFGVQVLIDVGPGLAPFRRDQRELLTGIRALIGIERTDVCYFAGSPARGVGPGGRWTWTAYRPPTPGTPVMIVSDFGIGDDRMAPTREDSGEWVRFLTRLRSAGHEPVGLIPYPADRWPPDIAACLRALVWDRSTTVGSARAVHR